MQYEITLELEVNEENLEDLQKCNIIKYKTDNNCYEDIFSFNQDIINEIEIPDDSHTKSTYVDNSFEIISFSFTK